MNVEDGRLVRRDTTVDCDVAVVGSGPAGAAAAAALSRGGTRVLVVEEGPRALPGDFSPEGFTAMARWYRDMGASMTIGRPPMPFLQGRVVGGGSVVNGAISWRLPRDVYDRWVAADPPLEEALPWGEIEAATDRAEADLNVAPTADGVAGANNLLLAKGAGALGVEHRPTARNVRECRGLGRCLQGCPEGRKMSVDLVYLADACARGALVYSSVRADAVIVDGGRAVGLACAAEGGGRVRVRAARAVVLAASAVQTPLILLRSGIRHGPVGLHFQAHPGASVAGWFEEPVRLWTGATQGREAIGLRREGIKFEALGFDMAILATRMRGAGGALARDIADLAHWADWGAAIRAEGEGRVSPGWGGRALVRYGLTRGDMQKVRRGVEVLGEMMLAAGARFVSLGVRGWHETAARESDLVRFGEEGPLDPMAYMMAVTHMFGTCRMGSGAAGNVVRPDFRHHAVEALYVADSSVFPTNTGVNPQTSIVAMALLCGRSVARSCR